MTPADAAAAIAATVPVLGFLIAMASDPAEMESISAYGLQIQDDEKTVVCMFTWSHDSILEFLQSLEEE